MSEAITNKETIVISDSTDDAQKMKEEGTENLTEERAEVHKPMETGDCDDATQPTAEGTDDWVAVDEITEDMDLNAEDQVVIAVESVQDEDIPKETQPKIEIRPSTEDFKEDFKKYRYSRVLILSPFLVDDWSNEVVNKHIQQADRYYINAVRKNGQTDIVGKLEITFARRCLAEAAHKEISETMGASYVRYISNSENYISISTTKRCRIVVVTGLPPKVMTVDKLQALFPNCASIIPGTTIITKDCGYAYIEYEDIKSAQHAGKVFRRNPIYIGKWLVKFTTLEREPERKQRIINNVNTLDSADVMIMEVSRDRQRAINAIRVLNRRLLFLKDLKEKRPLTAVQTESMTTIQAELKTEMDKKKELEKKWPAVVEYDTRIAKEREMRKNAKSGDSAGKNDSSSSSEKKDSTSSSSKDQSKSDSINKESSKSSSSKSHSGSNKDHSSSSRKDHSSSSSKDHSSGKESSSRSHRSSSSKRTSDTHDRSVKSMEDIRYEKQQKQSAERRLRDRDRRHRDDGRSGTRARSGDRSGDRDRSPVKSRSYDDKNLKPTAYAHIKAMPSTDSNSGVVTGRIRGPRPLSPTTAMTSGYQSTVIDMTRPLNLMGNLNNFNSGNAPVQDNFDRTGRANTGFMNQASNNSFMGNKPIQSLFSNTLNSNDFGQRNNMPNMPNNMGNNRGNSMNNTMGNSNMGNMGANMGGFSTSIPSYTSSNSFNSTPAMGLRNNTAPASSPRFNNNSEHDAYFRPNESWKYNNSNSGQTNNSFRNNNSGNTGGYKSMEYFNN